MKSQSHHHEDQCQPFEAQILNHEKKQINIFCSSSKVSTLVCMNKNCKQKAFLCEDQQCKCRQNHKKCLKLNNTSLLDHLISKKISLVDQFQTYVSNKIQTIIDQLSDFRDRIITEIKIKFQFIGLNKTQKKLIKDLEDGNFDQLSGSKVWEIIHFEDHNQNITTIINQTYQTLQNNFYHSNKMFSQNLKHISSTLKKCKEKVNKLFINESPKKQLIIKQGQSLNYFNFDKFTSNVIKKEAQYKKMLNLFGPKVFKQATLLYRASLNQFQIKKFHQKCDNIPNTLIILETNHGKKIGAYTPIPWKIPNASSYVEDKSMQSFLFSVTQNDKFSLSNRNKAVYHSSYEKNGIAFGSGHDLCIQNNANKVLCHASIDSSYKNKNYLFNDPESWQRFTGDHCSNNFLIKQWEVWSLAF